MGTSPIHFGFRAQNEIGTLPSFRCILLYTFYYNVLCNKLQLPRTWKIYYSIQRRRDLQEADRNFNCVFGLNEIENSRLPEGEK